VQVTQVSRKVKQLWCKSLKSYEKTKSSCLKRSQTALVQITQVLNKIKTALVQVTQVIRGVKQFWCKSLKSYGKSNSSGASHSSLTGSQTAGSKASRVQITQVLRGVKQSLKSYGESNSCGASHSSLTGSQTITQVLRGVKQLWCKSLKSYGESNSTCTRHSSLTESQATLVQVTQVYWIPLPLDINSILLCGLIPPFHDVAIADAGDDKSLIREAYGHQLDVL